MCIKRRRRGKAKSRGFLTGRDNFNEDSIIFKGAEKRKLISAKAKQF
ncbi:hypothetical protein DB42_EV00230 [Neochlamydia sp. EPS4]|nr:hypothetical protein DB42_EV00230 [Neochlamydia sp. EPS4]